MIRMRHAGQVQTRPEANEIILINSHDGASSNQMLAGMFRFVCCNGLVVGEVVEDIRIPHKGNIQGEVIEGAFRVLDEFEAVNEHTEAMKALQLQPSEEIAFATAALALRFGERGVEETGGHKPAPVTAEQLIEARRPEDIGHSLWTTFQRVQENVIRGGQPGRSAQGRRLQTRPVGSIVAVRRKSVDESATQGTGAAVIPSIRSSIPSRPPGASYRYRHRVTGHANFALESSSRTIDQ